MIFNAIKGLSKAVELQKYPTPFGTHIFAIPASSLSFFRLVPV